MGEVTKRAERKQENARLNSKKSSDDIRMKKQEKRFEEQESRMQKLDKNTTETIGKLIEHVKNGANPNNANKRKS